MFSPSMKLRLIKNLPGNFEEKEEEEKEEEEEEEEEDEEKEDGEEEDAYCVKFFLTANAQSRLN